MLEAKDPKQRSTNDDDRCENQDHNGQCRLRKVEGSNLCEVHGANKQLKAAEKKDIYNFQRSQFLALNEDQKRTYESRKYDVSAELGVCRVMLQKYLDKVKTYDDLGMYNHNITSLVSQISKLTEMILKTDQKLGTLMSEDDALAIAQALLDAVHGILSDYIDDPKQFAAAMTKANDTFMKALNVNTKE